MPCHLPIDEILATDRRDAGLASIGRSREGRDLLAATLGDGPARVSLVGGCHADEPVGPETLERLVAFLGTRPRAAPLLAAATWYVVPHANPDGRARNAAWSEAPRPGGGFDVGLYLRHAVREPPGEDVEFGFPREPGDAGARPENRAVASFLAAGAPFSLHGSFHGMGFAAGPWFLLEECWIGRTAGLREALRRAVAELGYRPLDVDRGGEKGFRRIDEGFSTRPDSAAMRSHFLALGDPDTAALFRPSSMELVRALGGDPLTFVTENPLFLVPDDAPDDLRSQLAALAGRDPDAVARRAAALGVRPMPIVDQARLQLSFLDRALAAAGV